jgi:Protein of unknown function (DUF1559)
MQTTCTANLTQIAFELRCYHDKYGCFPPAHTRDARGRPAHGWRVLILEFLEPELHSEYHFDEPWDGSNNRALVGRVPVFYHCPNGSSPAVGLTNYVALVRKEAQFPPDGSATSLKDLHKGGVGTIAVVETRDSGILWTEPRDFELDRMSLQIDCASGPCISSHVPEGPAAAMAIPERPYLTARRLGVNTSPEAVRALLNPRDDKSE